MLDFDARGLLPAGVHSCDEVEFSRLLVNKFPGDPTRATIRNGFFKLRERAESHGVAGTQWVDGSFVTQKHGPSDVDVVLFVKAEVLNDLDDDGKAFVLDVLARPHGAMSFKTDHYVVTVREPGHPQYDAYEKARLYWRDLFGKTKPLPLPAGGQVPGLPKGILSMGLGNEADQPSVSEEMTADVT